MIAHALEAFPGLTLSVFFVFCRIGSCLMVVPGFGSPRVPMQVRLFFSLGASVAIFPVLGEFEGVRQRADDLPFIARLACVEIAKGVFIGFMVRFFFGALQFVGEAAASALGIGMNQTSAEDGEQMPALTSFITLTAAALFFITDQHLELLRALIQSYNVFHFGLTIYDFDGNYKAIKNHSESKFLGRFLNSTNQKAIFRAEFFPEEIWCGNISDKPFYITGHREKDDFITSIHSFDSSIEKSFEFKGVENFIIDSVADLNNDSIPEIVFSDGSGVAKIMDPSGHIISRFDCSTSMPLGTVCQYQTYR